MSVAHVSGEKVELLPPMRVTDTHVVVNITDLSLWGLLRRIIPFLTIRGQVLAFHKLVNPLRPRLNLIVLPHNVPFQEVQSWAPMNHNAAVLVQFQPGPFQHVFPSLSLPNLSCLV